IPGTRVGDRDDAKRAVGDGRGKRRAGAAAAERGDRWWGGQVATAIEDGDLGAESARAIEICAVISPEGVVALLGGKQQVLGAVLPDANERVGRWIKRSGPGDGGRHIGEDPVIDRAAVREKDDLVRTVVDDRRRQPEAFELADGEPAGR